MEYRSCLHSVPYRVMHAVSFCLLQEHVQLPGSDRASLEGFPEEGVVPQSKLSLTLWCSPGWPCSIEPQSLECSSGRYIAPCLAWNCVLTDSITFLFWEDNCQQQVERVVLDRRGQEPGTMRVWIYEKWDNWKDIGVDWKDFNCLSRGESRETVTVPRYLVRTVY